MFEELPSTGVSGRTCICVWPDSHQLSANEAGCDSGPSMSCTPVGPSCGWNGRGFLRVSSGFCDARCRVAGASTGQHSLGSLPARQLQASIQKGFRKDLHVAGKAVRVDAEAP